MSQNDNPQYMNYLDYLIRVDSQQLITDNLKVNKIISNNNDNNINIEGNINSNDDIDCNNLNATNSINIKNNNTTKFTIDSNGDITKSNNITSSGNITSNSLNIKNNNSNVCTIDNSGNITSFGSFEVKNNNSKVFGIDNSGNITDCGTITSGNITSSGNISCNTFDIKNNDSSVFNIDNSGNITDCGTITSDNITSSGKISSTGNITSSSNISCNTFDIIKNNSSVFNIDNSGNITDCGTITSENITSENITSSGNITSKGLIIKDNNNITKLTITSDGKIIFNNESGLTSSTNDGSVIATQNYVDTATGHITDGLVGQFYPNKNDIKGEIFNDYEHNKAKGLYSHACGQNTYADQNNMFVCGQYNIYNENEPILNENKLFVVGNGNGIPNDPNERNDAFVVYNTGKAYAKVFSTIGSDYAELFEVYDETIPIKDYEYKFITLKGDKAKIACYDDYILGVYSSQPAILGNSPINNFKNKYIPVGLIGKLIVYDYGKCNVDGFCKVGFNGCAIPYDKYIDNDISHYRVIKRYDDDKIIIIFK